MDRPLKIKTSRALSRALLAKKPLLVSADHGDFVRFRGEDFKLRGNFGYADFCRAGIFRGSFMSAIFYKACFSFASLIDVAFVDCSLEGAVFAGAFLEGVTFINCSLKGTVFNGARGEVLIKGCRGNYSHDGSLVIDKGGDTVQNLTVFF